MRDKGRQPESIPLFAEQQRRSPAEPGLIQPTRCAISPCGQYVIVVGGSMFHRTDAGVAELSGCR
jgi:hypothetical protein